MNESWVDASVADGDVCFLPRAHSAQTYNEHIVSFFQKFRDATDVLQRELSVLDRTAIMNTFNVDESLIRTTLFSNLAFPLIVEYGVDYIGDRAQEILGRTGRFEPWEIDALTRAQLGVYVLHYDPGAHETVMAIDVHTNQSIPIHASVMGTPLRNGDCILARIYRTPLVNLVVSPSVIPHWIASEVFRSRDDGSVGATDILRLWIECVRKFNQPDNIASGSLLDALNAGWRSVRAGLPNQPVELDGITADGITYRLRFVPNTVMELFCFRDVHARTMVLSGGLHRETRGFIRLFDLEESDPAQAVGVTSIGPGLVRVEVDDACLKSILGVLYWLKQSLDNRAFDHAA